MLVGCVVCIIVRFGLVVWSLLVYVCVVVVCVVLLRCWSCLFFLLHLGLILCIMFSACLFVTVLLRCCFMCVLCVCYFIFEFYDLGVLLLFDCCCWLC